jgi:hypothetical protein
VYFFSDGEMAPYGISEGGLYLWENGQVRSIASGSYDPDPRYEVRATPDGRRLFIMIDRALTNNDHLKEVPELYMYDESTNRLTCISCPPTGAAATTGIDLAVNAASGGTPAFAVPSSPNFSTLDGRYVFFNTAEALVPQDTNNLTDAYEYDADTGKLSLLSTGTGEVGTWFVEASPSGHDVFLATRQRLTGWDQDKLGDLYDARIDGGFPEPPPVKVPCAGDACQGIPSAAPDFSVASEFNGLGNSPSAKPKGATKISPKAAAHGRQLKRALARCRKQRGRKRTTCVARARKRYGVKNPARRARRAAR